MNMFVYVNKKCVVGDQYNSVECWPAIVMTLLKCMAPDIMHAHSKLYKGQSGAWSLKSHLQARWSICSRWFMHVHLTICMCSIFLLVQFEMCTFEKLFMRLWNLLVTLGNTFETNLSPYIVSEEEQCCSQPEKSWGDLK